MKIALGLTLISAGLYLLTANGHLRGQDQEYYYRIARTIAHEHTFAIEPLVFANTELAGARGRDGRFYAQYAPGLPVFLVPFVLLGDSMTKVMSDFSSRYLWIHEGTDDVAPRIVVSYFNIPVTALSAGLFALLILQLGYSNVAALFTAASFALTTFAWGQSRIVFPEPLQTLLLLIACLLLFRESAKMSFAAGSVIGLAVLVKITSILVLPAFLLLPNANGVALWRKKSKVAAAILPVLIALAIYAWYNYSRFGSFIATGYNNSGKAAEFTGNGLANPLTGLYGLLFSSGRGLIWYAPVTIAAIAGSRCFFSERPQLARAFLVLASTWIVIHSFYKAWDSGWGWGPRYLLPVLPFILIALVGTLHSVAGKLTWVGLFVAGFAIQLPGALVDFMASGYSGMALFTRTAQQPTADAFVAWRNFQPPGSEVIRGSALLARGEVDLAWLTFRNTHLPIITFALVGLLIATGTAVLISGWSLQVSKGKRLPGTAP